MQNTTIYLYYLWWICITKPGWASYQWNPTKRRALASARNLEWSDRSCFAVLHICRRNGNYSQSECGQYSLQNMMLSHRACFLVAPNRRSKDGFSCCQVCYKSLTIGKMPKFAIANNYSFGSPWDCLLDLTDVELTMLTPVKTYGYLLSYTGGKQKQLKA
jgi:hypothetical protein